MQRRDTRGVGHDQGGAPQRVYRPWAVVNAAGFARVDRAESEPARCRRENVEGAATLGRACAAAGVPLLAFSFHLVFDGAKAGPYLEDDAVAPLGVYGGTKAEAKRELLAAFPDALVVRSGPFFGCPGTSAASPPARSGRWPQATTSPRRGRCARSRRR